MSKNEDLLIIGGGVIGVCTAYYLAEQDRHVTLVEKDDICAGSSYGNAGLIVPSHAVPLAVPGVLSQGLKWLLDNESPFYIKPRLSLELGRWLWQFRAACTEERMRQAIATLRDLSRASARLHSELAGLEGLNFGYQQRGGLYLYTQRHSLEKGIEETHLLQQFGIEAQVMDVEGVRQVEPSVLSSVVGGIFYPEDAHLIPDRFVHELARVVEARGVRIRGQTEVLGFETSNRRISAVITTRGSFHPAQVILAAGAWAPTVVRDLGLKLPIQPAKGYSMTFKRPPTGPEVPLHLSEHKVAVTPMGDMLRLGGTLELAGLDLSVNQQRVNAIRRAAGEYLGGTENLELIEVWRGLRPLTPDTLPMIGRSPTIENLIVAGGHGMLGMSLGPITGKLVSQIVAGESPAVDLAPLRVDRFQ